MDQHTTLESTKDFDEARYKPGSPDYDILADAVREAEKVEKAFAVHWQYLTANRPNALEFAALLRDEMVKRGYAVSTRVCRSELSVSHGAIASMYLKKAIKAFPAALEASKDEYGFVSPSKFVGELNDRIEANLPPQTIAALLRINGWGKLEKLVGRHRRKLYCKTL